MALRFVNRDENRVWKSEDEKKSVMDANQKDEEYAMKMAIVLERFIKEKQIGASENQTPPEQGVLCGLDEETMSQMAKALERAIKDKQKEKKRAESETSLNQLVLPPVSHLKENKGQPKKKEQVLSHLCTHFYGNFSDVSKMV